MPATLTVSYWLTVSAVESVSEPLEAISRVATEPLVPFNVAE